MRLNVAPIKSEPIWFSDPHKQKSKPCTLHSSPSSSENLFYSTNITATEDYDDNCSNSLSCEPYPAFAAPRSMWTETDTLNPDYANSYHANQLLDLSEPRKDVLGNIILAEDEMDDAQILMGFLSEPSLYNFLPTKDPVMNSPDPFLNDLGLDPRKKKPASRLCRVPGCTKGIRSKGLCKAHGGGRRCTTPGCTISDQGGGHCIAHGGGRRCSVDGCQKSAQSKGRCKLHGGSRRCRVESCTKNGQVKGLCRSHYSDMLAQEHGKVEKVAYKSF